jgi:hypothetical protein
VYGRVPPELVIILAVPSIPPLQDVEVDCPVGETPPSNQTSCNELQEVQVLTKTFAI